MANADSPFGLKLVGTKSGQVPRVRKYFAPSTYATNMFIGDAVDITGTSNTAVVTTATGSYDPATLPEINVTAGADADIFAGVIVGFDADPDNLGKNYGAASTNRVVHVCDDPEAVFEIQADGSIAATQVGLNGVLIATHSGSTVTGFSGYELDSGTTDAPAADASNPLTIRRLVARPDNATGANAVVEVTINSHRFAQGAIGV